VSKKAKLLERLRVTPTPTDFAWDDLVVVMKRAGFKEHCNGGSHYIFEHEATGFRFSMSKTHPSGVLKRYQVDAAKEALRNVGELGEDNYGR